jgi:hypothetical protein
MEPTPIGVGFYLRSPQTETYREHINTSLISSARVGGNNTVSHFPHENTYTPFFKWLTLHLRGHVPPPGTTLLPG